MVFLEFAIFYINLVDYFERMIPSFNQGNKFFNLIIRSRSLDEIRKEENNWACVGIIKTVNYAFS